ncbi:MAG: sigma-70 family RNA polymerase sigma factor [Planctomycetota bacterium]|nr:sigma-70 family RNA polymerase sigma factor [Planctomycetota bacterium]
MSASNDPTSSHAIGTLVEHFFRHESGRLVAALSRVFGLRNQDLVEDMVQSALVEAFQTWGRRGIPQNPSAWIHRVARNKILDALKHENTSRRLAPEFLRQNCPETNSPDESWFDTLFDDDSLADSQLRMIFVCCHPALARESQIALTLKTLCGFSFKEIGRALLSAEDSIKKRVQRARGQLAELRIELELPAAAEMGTRLGAVHQSLYLLFNEGYSASTGDVAIRRDLCDEAQRLTRLLTRCEMTRSPATFALMALMLFHTARFSSRTDGSGRILLLEEQNRTLWDQSLIQEGRNCLDRSARGEQISTYHLEAGIALLHCEAPRFAETNWPTILKLYDLLLRIQPSPIYRLNRAIVVAFVHGAAEGLRELDRLAEEAALQDYHLLDAARGDLCLRLGRHELARRHYESAKNKTASPIEQELLQRKILGIRGEEAKPQSGSNV